MKKWSHVLSAAILTVGICLGYGQEAQAMVGGKPVIGISWKSPKQAKSYEAFKKIITMAGGIPVELDQIKSTDRLPTPPMERWTRPMWNLLGC